MDNIFEEMDFGLLQQYLDNDDVTDISYDNGGQLWLRTLSHGTFRVENPGIDDNFMDKLAFQCANVVGRSFNAAHPFLDSESEQLRINFVHDSIARNGIALLMRKTPAKIRLKKEKILEDKYITETVHDFLLKCVEGHCNIIISGETGSGKTEFLKYLASHTKENEKLITIEDTLELHLDRIFPHRDIVAMKTNNIASYSDVLVTCMRQNPKWILLSEVRSAEAVTAVRNSISSGHNILSTIHADKASSIPSRLYSLLESNIDLEQFLRSIHRYVQIGVHIKGYYSTERQKFHREIAEVVEFYVTEDNVPKSNTIYKKTPDGRVTIHNPTKYLLGYLESQGLIMQPDILVKEQFKDPNEEEKKDSATEETTVEKTSEPVTPKVEEIKTPEPVTETPVDNNQVNNNVAPEQNKEDAQVQPVHVQPQEATPVQPQPAPSMPTIPQTVQQSQVQQQFSNMAVSPQAVQQPQVQVQPVQPQVMPNIPRPVNVQPQVIPNQNIGTNIVNNNQMRPMANQVMPQFNNQ